MRTEMYGPVKIGGPCEKCGLENHAGISCKKAKAAYDKSVHDFLAPVLKKFREEKAEPKRKVAATYVEHRRTAMKVTVKSEQEITNFHAVESAIAAVYRTTIEDDETANLRGKVIQALNRLAAKLGFDELVRAD